ncbi:MAG: phage tail protein [Firmicutes bacterium]|mgnify:CR=1 FL=1|nr:phage tail protein [Bacillota bacterium]
MSISDFWEIDQKNKSKISGVVIGIVTNNQDPEELGRVKVKLPRLSGEDESNWARVATFMAGNERGAFFLPEIDDEVLVAFEHGDINIPYVIGALWNGVDKPYETNRDGNNDRRVIKSRSGHLIRFDDQDGAEKIEIIDKTEKNFITIDAATNKITVSSEQNLELVAKNGKVVIDAQDVEIKSSNATKIEASADMELKASGNMIVKGATVNIN